MGLSTKIWAYVPRTSGGFRSDLYRRPGRGSPATDATAPADDRVPRRGERSPPPGGGTPVFVGWRVRLVAHSRLFAPLHPVGPFLPRACRERALWVLRTFGLFGFGVRNAPAPPAFRFSAKNRRFLAWTGLRVCGFPAVIGLSADCVPAILSCGRTCESAERSGVDSRFSRVGLGCCGLLR